MSITLEQVLKAYEYADSHPHKYLRGTTNWCAAVAHALNAEQPEPVADSTTSDKYKAELYDEVWQLARSMGFNNVTDALTGRVTTGESESECTSCDGSGEYTDAIGDWRGYCTCSAGVEAESLKGDKP